MDKSRPTTSVWRKILRAVLLTLLTLIILLGLAVYALTLPSVQQKITGKVETYLHDKLGTRVEVGAIRLRFPYYVSLERFLLEDQQGDTLARVGSLKIQVGMWKLLNQTIELQSLILEDASVHLHRRDSVYNFDFIAQAFAKKDTASVVPVDTTASAWKFQLDLATLRLKSVDFSLQDEDSGSSMTANVGTATVKINKSDLKTLRFELDEFSLANTRFRMEETKIIPKSGKPSPAFALLLNNGDITNSSILYSTTELFFKAQLEATQLEDLLVESADDGMRIHTGNVTVQNSAITYRDPVAKPTPGHLNAGDLDLSSLDADVAEFSMQNDTMFVQANDLAALDKSGVNINSLQAGLLVTPGSIQVKDATARLNQTVLSGDAILYKNEKATFDRMNIHIRQAKGVVGDLLRVMPPLDNTSIAGLQDMPFEVSGNINGSLQNLQTEQMRFRAGKGTVAYFSGTIRQLDNPDKLGMNLNISRLETVRPDLLLFMRVGGTPADSAAATPLPAYISAHGSLDGDMAKLRVALEGEAGAIQTGPSNQPLNDPPLVFSIAGSLSHLNNPDLLGMDLNIQRLEAPRAFFAFLEPKGIRMPEQLTATGTLKGTLKSLDTDLTFNALRSGMISTLSLKGLLKNLQAPDRLGFDVAFKSTLSRLEILGYIPDTLIDRTIRLPATVQVDGTARGTVQNMAAVANIGLGGWGQIRLDGTLRDSSYKGTLVAQNLRVNQLLVDSTFKPLRMIGLHADLSGEGFQFLKTARLTLSSKVDSLIWDELILRDIELTADVDGKRFNATLKSPDERAAVNIKASGDFTPRAPLLETDISLNCVDLRAFGWSNRPTTVCMRIRSRSEGLSVDTLKATVYIEAIDLQYDTVHVHPGDLILDLKLDNRKNAINIASDWLKGDIKGYFTIADLPKMIDNIASQYFIVDRSGYVPPASTDSLSFQLQLLKTDVFTTGLVPGLTELRPSDMEGSLNGPRNSFDFKARIPRVAYLDWQVDSLNARAYAGDSAALLLVTSRLIRRDGQSFVENAAINGRLIDNTAKVSLSARNSEGKDRFLVAADAKLKGKDVFLSLAPQMIIDYQPWSVDAKNQIKISEKGVEVKDFTMLGNGQSVKIEGATRALDNKRTGLDFTVNIDRLNFNNFDVFVSNYVTELQGWMETDMKIGGNTDSPEIQGELLFHETVFTPALTNVRYELSETPLKFTADGLALEGLTLRDPYGKTMEIKGKILTSDWANLRSEISVKSEKFQVLNTTRLQNPSFFGHVFVTMQGSMKGPMSESDIVLNVKTEKESDFTYIYDAASQDLQHEGIVVFVEPARAYVRPPIYDAPVTASGFNLSASIEIDSNLTVNTVIDPVTGDNFNGKATGRLQLDLYSNGNMTLSGRMELVRGVYNYSYQGVVQRRFDVVSGSSIIWSGDVGSPELQIKARYAFKASPYPLVVNQLAVATPEEIALYRGKQAFYLQTNLNGTPNDPDVHFQFMSGGANQANKGVAESFGNADGSLVTGALNNVNQDPNLLSRQVFGVLLLRSFIGESAGAPSSINAADPLRSGLTDFLTGQVNALAAQYLTFIDVEVAAVDDPTKGGSGQAEGSTNYQLRLQKSFFDDRLTFKLSGGATLGSDEAQSGLDNASVEYAVTRDGRVKISVFSEKGFELLNASSSNLRNSGAGIILTKEFNGTHKRRKQ